ncbi:MAG: lysis protein [Pantoea sp.]|uniref:lysis protein n=1 Tax=Pantoea sp. TaxID=69393 RepID=UPI002394D39F|nr:lysis protein [Pantoea sp.]MDE1188213.1 lysis protein [Pantoea sp.]
MTAEIKAGIVIVLLIMLFSLIGAGGYFGYRYKSNSVRADTAEQNLNLAKDTINDMQVRQRDVAALDSKYTKELSDAQATIDQLRADVDSGKRRLQLSATCPTSNATGPTSVDDAASPRLTDSAQRDYFTLRSRIETAGKQIAGLQQYIREQCLN